MEQTQGNSNDEFLEQLDLLEDRSPSFPSGLEEETKSNQKSAKSSLLSKDGEGMFF